MSMMATTASRSQNRHVRVEVNGLFMRNSFKRSSQRRVQCPAVAKVVKTVN
jgi:hypothetical protein